MLDKYQMVFYSLTASYLSPLLEYDERQVFWSNKEKFFLWILGVTQFLHGLPAFPEESQQNHCKCDNLYVKRQRLRFYNL